MPTSPLCRLRNLCVGIINVFTNEVKIINLHSGNMELSCLMQYVYGELFHLCSSTVGSTAPTTSSTSPVTGASGSDPGSSVLNSSGSGISGSSDFGSDFPGEANTGNGWHSILSSGWSWEGLFSTLALPYVGGIF